MRLHIPLTLLMAIRCDTLMNDPSFAHLRFEEEWSDLNNVCLCGNAKGQVRD